MTPKGAGQVKLMYRKTGMNRAKMLQLAEQAGFVMWSKDSDWKPKGATIDWSCDYDKELRKFTKLVVAECNKVYEVKPK
jgi:hypothetical protein